MPQHRALPITPYYSSCCGASPYLALTDDDEERHGICSRCGSFSSFVSLRALPDKVRAIVFLEE